MKLKKLKKCTVCKYPKGAQGFYYACSSCSGKDPSSIVFERKTVSGDIESSNLVDCDKVITKNSYTLKKQRMIDKYMRLMLNYYRLNEYGLLKVKSLEEEWVKGGNNISNLKFYEAYKRHVGLNDVDFYKLIEEREVRNESI